MDTTGRPSPSTYGGFGGRSPPSPSFSRVSGGLGSSSAFAATAPLLSSSVDELVDKALNKTAAVQVVVRVRPLSSAELAAADNEPVLRVANTFRNEYRTLEAVVSRNGDKETVRRFTFDRVAPPEISQRELFDLSGVKELMEATLMGLNVSIFAYGQTGSGKTYSMSGVEEVIDSGALISENTMGIIPRAINHLFSRIREESEGSTTVMRCSYSEIYNEEVYDLLHLTGRRLPLRYDQMNNSFFVEGQVIVQCCTAEEVMAVVREGHRNRTVSSHKLNVDSSRSHSILQVQLERNVFDPETGETTRSNSKAMFIDLAGSERLKKSGSHGTTAGETREINKSLFTLGKVIAALSERRGAPGGPAPRSGAAFAASTAGGGGGGSPRSTISSSSVRGGGGGGGLGATSGGGPDDAHIPYRDSKLTRLLRDSLGGSALTIMIACVSPAAAYLEESLNTLMYAARASCIENTPIFHVDSKDAVIMGMKRDLRQARGENAALRAKFSLPPEGPIIDLLQSLPMMVPVDTVLVEQPAEVPTQDDSVQTEPLHPSHLAPRMPRRVGGAAEDVAGKGTLGGRQRARLLNGQTSTRSGGGASHTGGGEGGGGGTHVTIVTEAEAAAAGGGAIWAGSPFETQRTAGAFVGSRMAERSADRSSKQVVLDMQQGEIAALSEERTLLREKAATMRARLNVVVGEAAAMRENIARLESELDSARRAKRDAEKTVQSVLTGAAAAGWPLPFPLAAPLGPVGGNVVPFATSPSRRAPAHPPTAVTAEYNAAFEAQNALRAELYAAGGGEPYDVDGIGASLSAQRAAIAGLQAQQTRAEFDAAVAAAAADVARGPGGGVNFSSPNRAVREVAASRRHGLSTGAF